MPSGANPMPTPLTRAIAARLRARIGELNITAKVVAERSGIPTATLSRLLNEKKPIYVEQLDALCSALNLDIAAVLDAADRASRRRHLTLVTDDDVDALMTLNPAAFDADGDDLDAEVEAQQQEP
ncbi:helix-turn-helix domain-containing protein [Cellulomonas iranensis]|uniref:helix-turn-helix domain-containing protein n=1 Tax=Cellulomonas iranensis TaxID=76862 RepID=UPI0015C585F0|nr:helix-turn-helix transcriptional regulator [Cellulomonas iranensis]